MVYRATLTQTDNTTDTTQLHFDYKMIIFSYRYQSVILNIYDCIMNFIKNNYELILASLLFTLIIATHYPFYKAIILMLEFIVIVEVIKMIAEFIEKKRLRLRYILDVFIIFLIRDVIILTTHPEKPYVDILFLLLVILAFFIFRILSVQFSPTLHKKYKEKKEAIPTDK